ncbi:MAG TPA: spore coat associated protein CotJA [Bacilli bacterium]
MNSQIRSYETFAGPFDPCPPIPCKEYIIPPNVFTSFQPMGLPQFTPQEALKYGTLWPAFYSPYKSQK